MSRRPLIKMGNIARVNIDLSRIEYIPDSEAVSPLHRLRYGDVLFNTRNTLDLVGKVSIWRDELPVAYYNSNILKLEFKSEYCGDSRYFGYALNSAESIEAIRNLATGTTSVAAVYTRDLLKLEIPVPSKSEQCAIADTLEDVERLISSLVLLIAKKQAIKQGIMQRLLTRRVRRSDLSEPREETRLRDLGMVYGGLTGKRKGDFGQGVAAFVTFLDVVNNVRLMTPELGRVRVHESEPQHRVMRGDVLFNGSSETPEEVALAAVVDFDAGSNTYLNSFCFGYRIRRPDLVDPTFLAYFFRSGVGRASVASLAQGATRYNIAKSKFLDLALALPCLEEQQGTVAVLNDSEEEIEFLRARLAKAREIKRGMMQELLTGRTRLPVQGESSE